MALSGETNHLGDQNRQKPASFQVCDQCCSRTRLHELQGDLGTCHTPMSYPVLLFPAQGPLISLREDPRESHQFCGRTHVMGNIKSGRLQQKTLPDTSEVLNKNTHIHTQLAFFPRTVLLNPELAFFLDLRRNQNPPLAPTRSRAAHAPKTSHAERRWGSWPPRSSRSVSRSCAPRCAAKCRRDRVTPGRLVAENWRKVPVLSWSWLFGDALSP